MFAFIGKNWKTTALGVASFLIAGLVGTGVITKEQAETAGLIIAGIIGILAKDGNVTGT